MELIRRLEQIGYRFNERLTFEYTKPGTNPPPEAEALLADLSKHKREAIIYLAERNNSELNARASERYRVSIAKGIQAAQSPYKLLLQAIECIAAMTCDELFMRQSKADILAIYGYGLSEPEAVEIELSEVRDKLSKLERALEANRDTPDGRRIERAIESLKQREKQLVALTPEPRANQEARA